MNFFKTIRSKILVFFIVQSFLICATLILFSQIHSTKIMMKNIDKNSQLIVSSYEDRISKWFSERKTDMESIAIMDSVKSMNWDKSEKYLKDFVVSSRGNFMFIFIADINGDYHTTFMRNAGNISDRDYFKEVISGKTVITEPLISKSTKKLISLVIVPIKNDAGIVVGLIAGAIDTIAMSEWIEGFKLQSDNSYSFVINKDGVVIFHPDHSAISNLNIFNLLNEIHAKKLGNSFSTNEGKIAYTYNKIKHYAFFTEIKDTPSWRIITKIDTSSIKKPIYFMALNLMITMFLLIILVILCGIIFSNRISSPIKRLRDVFKNGVEGDLSIRADIKSNDEIGEAATYFNKLMDMSNALVDEIADTGRELQDYIDNIYTYNCKISTDGTISIINDSMALKLSTGKESIIGKKIWELDWFSHTIGAVERTKENIKKVIAGDTVRFEETIKKGDHEFLALEYMLRFVKNRDAKPSYIILEARDITEKIMLENEILNIKKLESIGILAGGIAHDFNNIMTGILGMLSLAKYYTKEGDNIREKIEVAERATLKAKDLTQQLLTFSKGGFPLKRTVNISSLLKESVDFVLRGSNVKSEISIPQDVLPVDIDEGQMNQVFSNITINARQAMPGGGKLQVSVENFSNEQKINPILERKKYLKIIFTDTGVGIAEEIQKRIFDPYFTTKKDGSGLGLATSYSIVRKHDGYISVDSIEKKGTSFTIYLPVSSKGNIAKNKVAPVISEKSFDKISDRLEQSSNKRILVMDDDDIVIKVASGILKYWGYTVVTSADGLDTVLKIKEGLNFGNRIDLVILDLTIPGGAGGKEVIETIKDIDPNIKAIVSSGYSNDPVVADFEKYGFDGVVSKPYIAEELINIIKKLLG